MLGKQLATTLWSAECKQAAGDQQLILWVYVVEVWMLEVGKEDVSHAGAQIFVSRGLWKVMARLRLQA